MGMPIVFLASLVVRRLSAVSLLNVVLRCLIKIKSADMTPFCAPINTPKQVKSGDGEHISLLIYQRFKAFCPQFVRRLSDQLGQLVDDQTVILGFDLINQIRVRFECNRDI